MGRGFTDRDDKNAPKVAIINEAAARKYYKGENPIGLRFGTSVEKSRTYEIVGILRDTKYAGIRDEVQPTMYEPYMQGRGAGVFEVRTAGDPTASVGAIREAVRQSIRTCRSWISRRTWNKWRRAWRRRGRSRWRIRGSATGRPAGVDRAVRVDVVQRLAADQRDRHPDGARRAAAGRAAPGHERVDDPRGGRRRDRPAIAVAASRLVTSLLFGLAPTDGVSIATALLVMISVSALAGYLPARRAARVDPLEALRYE